MVHYNAIDTPNQFLGRVFYLLYQVDYLYNLY